MFDRAIFDEEIFDCGASVPFVGKSLWQFERDRRDARARLEAETARQAANEPTIEPVSEALPDIRPEPAYIAQRLVGFALLLEREREIQRLAAIEEQRLAFELAELQQQAIAAAQAQYELELQQAADEGAAVAFLCWLMLED